jgi:hypothetical protein
MARKLKPEHPGAILLEEFMKPLCLSMNGMPYKRLVLLGSIWGCGGVGAGKKLIYGALLLANAVTCHSGPEGAEALYRGGDLRY